MMIYIRFVQEKQYKLDCYSASSLKQQSTARHVAPPGYISLISSRPVLSRTVVCLEQRTNKYYLLIVFGLTRAGSDPTSYRSR